MKSNDSQIVDCLPLPIMVVKANTPIFTITRVNTRYIETVNKTAEELVGKSLFEVYPNINHNLDNLIEIAEKVIRTKTTQLAPVLKYDLNGEERYWSLEYVPLVKDGVVESIIQYTQDITPLIKLGMPL